MEPPGKVSPRHSPRSWAVLVLTFLPGCGGGGGSPPTPADSSPPSVPAAVTATALDSQSIQLQWGASTDSGSGVGGYRVLRGGTVVATVVAPGLTYTDTGLQRGVTYTYAVRAFDLATPTPNESAASPSVSATVAESVYVSTPYAIYEYSPSGTRATRMLRYAVAPRAMAFDRAGNLYVSDAATNSIQVRSADGSFRVFAEKGLLTPRGLGFDAAGNLYVASTGNGTVMKFDASGNGRVLASGLSLIDGHLALDAAGNVYVDELKIDTSERVSRFTMGTYSGEPFAWSQGAFYLAHRASVGGQVDYCEAYRFTPGGSETLLGRISGACSAIAVDASGNVYLGHARVSPQGNVTQPFGKPAKPAALDVTAIAIDPAGRVWRSYVDEASGFFRPSSGRIERVSSDGTTERMASTIAGEVTGTAVDSGGNLLVADAASATIWKYSRAGIGSVAARTGLLHPVDVDVDATGDLYVVDDTLGVVRVFNADGTFRDLATRATGLAETPRKLAIDRGGLVYVAGLLAGNTGVIQRITTAGQVQAFATLGQFEVARDLVVDAQGVVYATAGGGGQGIERYSTAGVRTVIPTADVPYALAIDAGGGLHSVGFQATSGATVPTRTQYVAATGAVVSAAALPFSDYDLGSLSIDRNGDLFVGGRGRVDRLPASGTPSVFAWVGAQGLKLVGVDAADNFYVENRASAYIEDAVYTVSKYSTAGALTQVITTPMATRARSAFAVDDTGTVYGALQRGTQTTDVWAFAPDGSRRLIVSLNGGVRAITYEAGGNLLVAITEPAQTVSQPGISPICSTPLLVYRVGIQGGSTSLARQPIARCEFTDLYEFGTKLASRSGVATYVIAPDGIGTVGAIKKVETNGTLSFAMRDPYPFGLAFDSAGNLLFAQAQAVQPHAVAVLFRLAPNGVVSKYIPVLHEFDPSCPPPCNGGPNGLAVRR